MVLNRKVRTVYYRILVPVDGTPHSRRALVEAIRIARDARARLRLLFIVEDLDPWDLHLYLHIRRILRASEEHGMRVLSAALDLTDRAGLTADPIMRHAEGRPIHTLITEEAEVAQTGLVIMGSRGGFSLGPFQFGSIAQKVAQCTRVPVMILPWK